MIKEKQIPNSRSSDMFFWTWWRTHVSHRTQNPSKWVSFINVPRGTVKMNERVNEIHVPQNFIYTHYDWPIKPIHSVYCCLMKVLYFIFHARPTFNFCSTFPVFLTQTCCSAWHMTAVKRYNLMWTLCLIYVCFSELTFAFLIYSLLVFLPNQPLSHTNIPYILHKIYYAFSRNTFSRPEFQLVDR